MRSGCGVFRLRRERHLEFCRLPVMAIEDVSRMIEFRGSRIVAGLFGGVESYNRIGVGEGGERTDVRAESIFCLYLL